MRHHDKFKVLGRERGQRTALVRSLLRSLVIHEGITTTETKAKELRKYIEPMITTAKKGTLASRRSVASKMDDVTAAKKLFEVIAPKYADRKGGYSRIINRDGDLAFFWRKLNGI